MFRVWRGGGGEGRKHVSKTLRRLEELRLQKPAPATSRILKLGHAEAHNQRTHEVPFGVCVDQTCHQQSSPCWSGVQPHSWQGTRSHNLFYTFYWRSLLTSFRKVHRWKSVATRHLFGTSNVGRERLGRVSTFHFLHLMMPNILILLTRGCSLKSQLFNRSPHNNCLVAKHLYNKIK